MHLSFGAILIHLCNFIYFKIMATVFVENCSLRHICANVFQVLFIAPKKVFTYNSLAPL